MILREYQREATGAVLGAWQAGTRAPAIVLATGLGKTVILAELCRIAVRAMNLRPVILVHRDELVRQTVDKLERADAGLRIGIIQGQNLGIARTDVVVASVQTLIRRIGPKARIAITPDRFSAVIVDECHHAAASSYLAILDHFGDALRLGVTATLARGDGRGLGEVWDDVVYERDIAWGVEHGYLVPAEVRTVTLAGLDTSKVRKAIDGDLAAGDLGKAMSSVHAGERIAEAYVRFGQTAQGRLRRAISFAPTVEVAEAWTGDYEAAGARCAVINGATPTNVRQAAYRDLAAGRIDVLSSVMVLTEGFDLPAVEVAIVGRPTKSMPLLTQMVGRVLRPSPSTGKEAALILDVVGAMGGGLARSVDLSIPPPPAPVAPPADYEPVRRERLEVAPPPEVEWVAWDLHGNPITEVRRRKGHGGPEWLRTYGGVPFLPRTADFQDLLFCWARDGTPTPWWRKARGKAPEPLVLAAEGDLRSIHPGIPARLDTQPATMAQLELLGRLGLRDAGTEPPTRLEASNMIEIHFASAELDRFARPRMAR